MIPAIYFYNTSTLDYILHQEKVKPEAQRGYDTLNPPRTSESTRHQNSMPTCIPVQYYVRSILSRINIPTAKMIVQS